MLKGFFSTCAGLAPWSDAESTEGFIVVAGERYSSCCSLHKARLYFCEQQELWEHMQRHMDTGNKTSQKIRKMG